MSEFALGTDDFAKEQKALEACWRACGPLDTQARDRVIMWLRNWARNEAPRGDRDRADSF